MTKTELTRKAEQLLWKENAKMGTFGCFEVTIGIGTGREIVDFITYSTTGEFRCYEIKVSKSDFNSSAKLSFKGDFNYYVMPIELCKQLRADAEKEKEAWSQKHPKYKDDGKNWFDEKLKNSRIGLIEFGRNLTTTIKPKRKSVNMGMKSALLESMLRSTNREVKKFYRVQPYWGPKMMEDQ
ncbi:hypothetical protein [Enterococcus larvae]|uniref:hypothetical protein n=1 Tax=Enterococcus larvae TaxID=2794352 RepID=UPI003F3DE1E9